MVWGPPQSALLWPLSSTFCTGCSAVPPASSFSETPPSSPSPSRITARSCLPIFSRTSLHQCPPPSPLVSHISPTNLRQTCLGPTRPPPLGPSSPWHHLHTSRLLPTPEPSGQGKSSQVMFGKITNASWCRTRQPGLVLSPYHPCPAATPAPSFQQAPSTGVDLPGQPLSPELRPEAPPLITCPSHLAVSPL